MSSGENGLELLRDGEGGPGFSNGGGSMNRYYTNVLGIKQVPFLIYETVLTAVSSFEKCRNMTRASAMFNI